MLASVPMTSVFIFATLGPIIVTLLVLLLVGDRSGRTSLTRWSLIWRTALAGALVPIGLAVLSIPTSLFGGHHPNTTAQALIFSAELAVIAVIALPVLVRQWRLGSAEHNRFAHTFGSLYLVVLAALWVSASHDYFAARHGITPDGTPTGNLAYAAVCFVVAALAVYSVSTKAGTSKSSAPALAPPNAGT